MAYDFTTRVDRSCAGSLKWDLMRAADPKVPAGIVPLTLEDMEYRAAPELLHLFADLSRGADLGLPAAEESYLEAVCAWQRRRHGWELKRAWTVPVAGVELALHAAVRALTEPGDGIIVQEPAGEEVRAAIEHCGRVTVGNPLKLDGGRHEMDFRDLERKAALANTRALILCSPHNPCGRVWSASELSRVLKICTSHDVALIVDETRDDLALPPYEHVALMGLPEAACARVIDITSPCTSFNLAGVPCANVFIAHEDVRERFCAALAETGVTRLPALSYLACETAYTSCARWLDELLVALARNRETLNGFFSSYLPSVGVAPLEGTYLQWLDFSAWHLEQDALMRLLTREAHLFVMDGTRFGQGGEGCVRLNLACPPMVLHEALGRLLAAAKAHELT